MSQPEIGKIVKSNSHIDYVCQIYAPGEAELLPEPTEYTFGTFVAIDLEADDFGTHVADRQLIGVIYDTLLMNPDFGNMGPRLSPREEMEVFTPDYLAETATLVGVIAVGWMDAEGGYHQGVPVVAGTVNNKVHPLTENELCAFHRNGGDGPCLQYVPVLMNQRSPLAPQLMMTVIDNLMDLFEDEGYKSQLRVMRDNLAWKSIVQPVG